MAKIKPFRALRPVSEKARSVSSVPYDVIHDEAEVRAFIATNPLSFLRITRADVEADLSDEECMVRARNNLTDLIDSHTLILDDEPAYYAYRLKGGDHTQIGIVACCSLEEYEKGKIKKHEKTRPDKVADRTRHMLELRAQTGLIFLAYRGTEAINQLVEEAMQADPLYDFVCDTGVSQTVWKIRDTEAITSAFDDVPALYIADGHHRIESALRARNEIQRKETNGNGEGSYNYVMAGLFPAEQLKILAYNRVVKDLEHLSDQDILAGIEKNFSVAEADRSVPETHGEICMYLSGKWYDLQLDVNLLKNPDPIEGLDVSILQHYILEPVLGIADPSTDKRIKFVGGILGTGELQRMVDAGDARIAFSLYPTTMDDLFAVSDMGEVMPPKSTWFEPKLKDGLFVHLI
ncbi:MAG TPA: DUF1015 family protein [Pyrinomonadaceae bacterium]|nr:DUF1015 family protein [Pyrinomonadaceae bacterium]